MRILTTMMFILAFASASAQDVSERIIEIGKSDNRSMKHLDVLSNRIGGRPIGSDAYANATEWAAREMRKWGMEVTVEQVGTLPVGFNRGHWSGKMLSQDGMMLNFVTPSYTSGTKGVQRGHVVMEPYTTAEFNQMKGVLKGAWVLINGKNNGWAIDYFSKASDSLRTAAKAHNDTVWSTNRNIKEYNAQHKTKKPFLEYIEIPALFYHEMRKAGILGIIQSSEVPLRALYDRNIFADMTFDSLPDIPDIKLDEQQYSVIAEKVKRREYFQLEFDIRNHFKPGTVPYHNVIGTIRGTEFPDEYVLAGGHLDAFDVGTGGVDCGSGSTVTMEAGRLIMAAGGSKPRRSILICLWAGEEFGLLGSKFWVENNTDKLSQISNYFNRDGGPLVTSGLNVPQDIFTILEPICMPLNSINSDFPFTLRKVVAQPIAPPKEAGGSDHAYFAMNGVPVLSLATSDPKGYNFSYGEIWHSDRDLYNKSIPEYQEHSAIVTAILMWGLANADTLLPRKSLYVAQ